MGQYFIGRLLAFFYITCFNRRWLYAHFKLNIKGEFMFWKKIDEVDFFNYVVSEAKKREAYSVFIYKVLNAVKIYLSVDRIAYFRYDDMQRKYFPIEEISFHYFFSSLREQKYQNLIPIEHLKEREWFFSPDELRAKLKFDICYPFVVTNKKGGRYLTLVALGFEKRSRAKKFMNDKTFKLSLFKMGKLIENAISMKHAFDTDIINTKMRLEIDGITGCFNRRLFNEHLVQQTKLGVRFYLIICDIDRFKSVNDEFGHQMGDVVLSKVAEALDVPSIKNPTVYRYGGEEFAVIFKVFDGEDVRIEKYITQVQRQMAKIDVIDRPVTMSFGYCLWQSGMDINLLKDAADTALYFVKHNGRNGVKEAIVTPEILELFNSGLLNKKTEERIKVFFS